jgi:hypothetical protein
MYDKSVYRVKRLHDFFVSGISNDDVDALNGLIVANSKECAYFGLPRDENAVRVCEMYSHFKYQKALVLSHAVDEHDNCRILMHVAIDFPNLNIALSFVSVPEKIKQKRMQLSRSRKVDAAKKSGSGKSVKYLPISETRRSL